MNKYNVLLTLPCKCNPRYKDLYFKEECRVIGGNKGDIHFHGYDVEGEETVLYLPVLHTSLGLSADESQDMAESILSEAYDSIGSEVLH